MDSHDLNAAQCLEECKEWFTAMRPRNGAVYVKAVCRTENFHCCAQWVVGTPMEKHF